MFDVAVDSVTEPPFTRRSAAAPRGAHPWVLQMAYSLLHRLPRYLGPGGASSPPVSPGLARRWDQSSCPTSPVPLERDFDTAFAARLAVKEKQIQQNYRPIVGIHKWFARRPGTLFRNLLLAEFNGAEPVATGFYRGHTFEGVIADPFAGGGTPTFEANRLGFSVVATDVNPMAAWIVRQGLAELDLEAFAAAARAVVDDVEAEVGDLYRTRCLSCGSDADVKYFLHVKTLPCPACAHVVDLFPGYLLAEDSRHPRNVLACAQCGELNECPEVPTRDNPARCRGCAGDVYVDGPARRNQVSCPACATTFRYPPKPSTGRLRHRMWAMEYHCHACKPGWEGRFFKKPDAEDLGRVAAAEQRLTDLGGVLPIPGDRIPPGDESTRLHRWGYEFYHEMFADRQLLGLGILLRRICEEPEEEARHALLTVFSDILRYQNLLCRYDTYALKCQDIFSVHGFPVGLVQCENNLLGIPGVGSGSFRHFVEKYAKAKRYCLAPFETRQTGTRKETVHVRGERIGAAFVDRTPDPAAREAQIVAAPATCVPLPVGSLAGVFTDPPYFDAVQYAELMDFCFTWLRQGLRDERPEFTGETTRNAQELTGNDSMGRGLDHFTEGLSEVFRHYAAALQPGAPFVFTYHHNDPVAYTPLVVAILDAGLDCTATLAAPAEMGASLHIKGTDSSILDSVFVCRATGAHVDTRGIVEVLSADVAALRAAGLRPTRGDLRCLTSGHVARVAINDLRATWSPRRPLLERMAMASEVLERVARTYDPDMIARLLEAPHASAPSGARTIVAEQLEAPL